MKPTIYNPKVRPTVYRPRIEPVPQRTDKEQLDVMQGTLSAAATSQPSDR